MLAATFHMALILMFRSLFFILRLTLLWGLAVVVVVSLYSSIPVVGDFDFPAIVFSFGTLALVVTGAFSHLHRVRLIAGRIDRETLANRQTRRIEMPFEAGDAFDVIDAAIHELPGVGPIQSTHDSLQIKAKVARPTTYGEPLLRRHWNPLLWFAPSHNQLLATVTPADATGRLTLICEPESPAWSDWFLVDDGTNFENAEALVRAIARRIGERRRHEQASAAQTATEKELTEARLHLLHAQVEPHFLYNTLASAKLLTQSDPVRAEAMLGHLIQYLRRSLPKAEDEMSTLGAELERALAYLEILKIRMGERLTVVVDVAAPLRATPLPAMMLQTLVENAIKHGLEPRTGGGTVWIRAHADEARVAVTVADDGEGLNNNTSGTGIGLKNVRERLRLRYGSAANLAVIANFPNGVATTLTLPVQNVAEHV